MNRKRITILHLILSVLLLTWACINVVGAVAEERRTVYSMDKFFLGLKVNIMAPYEADPGENITVTIKAEVSGDTHVEFIHINIYGLKNETTEISLADIYLSPAPHEEDYIVTIHNDTSPGLIYGKIEWKWTHEGATIAPPPAGFVVTYVKNVELEELQGAYDSLLVNCTKLENYKNELGSTRNVMYILVATTVVSAATVLILLLRRPKRLWT
jgi:hypothetical protein